MRFSKALTKKQKKKLIRIAWRQLERFIRDWQKSPYEWNKERDVQVEIASRIKSAYERRKKNRYWAKYKKYVIKGFEQGQTYSRICCEPAIYYKYKDGKRYICRPDIVIWDDIEHPESPNEENYEKKTNDPMLWICEVKYRPPWRTDDAKRKSFWDLDKMSYLLKQKDGTKYACWLHINFRRALSGNGFRKIVSENGRLRRYDIRMPSIKH